jgi:hypothetical protein
MPYQSKTTARKPTQVHNRSKSAAAQHSSTTSLTDVVRRVQKAGGTATPDDIVMLQRALGNRATQQILGNTIQRQPQEEDEFLDERERDVSRIEDVTYPLLKFALKTGNYVQANTLFSDLADNWWIVGARSDIKEVIEFNWKMLKNIVHGLGELSRLGKVRFSAIIGRYNTLAKKIDALANKYEQVPQLYSLGGVGDYKTARKERKTKKNVLVQEEI